MLHLTEKYRPHSFEEVAGQDHVVKMLKKYIELKLSMPIILNGPYGCGKTTLATIFATQLHPSDVHSQIWMNAHPGVIKINAANKTGVKQITELLETVQYQPLQGINKVYIIDEAHTLSHASYNAFLETLEFLPPNTYFIFATTDKDKIIDPLRSRCFQLNLNSLGNDAIVARLMYIRDKENIAIADDCIDLIAEHSNGSVRDAVKYLEQTRMISPTRSEIAEMLEIPSDDLVSDILNAITIADYQYLAKIDELTKLPPVNIMTSLIKAIDRRNDFETWMPVLQSFLDSFEVIRFGLHESLILKIALSKAAYVYKLASGLNIVTPAKKPQTLEHKIKELFPNANQEY